MSAFELINKNLPSESFAKDSTNDHFVSRFENQYVRDLAWLFWSPSILNFSNGFQRQPLDSKWLEQLDKNPQGLVEHLSSKNLKMLGPYFEALWEFYFNHYPGVKLIAKNLQVFDQGKTIGEYDFIYRDLKSKRNYHLEVAVKYYLGNQRKIEEIQEKRGLDLSSPQAQCLWVGPGTRDRLDKKSLKLSQHQSQLSATVAGKSALKSVGIQQVTSHVCLLGYLFYPVDYQMLPPFDVRDNHLRSCWLTKESIPLYLDSNSKFAIVDKPHWLAPISSSDRKLLDRNQLESSLATQFSEIPHPRLIAEFKQISTKNTKETHELTGLSSNFYFIVPKEWPKR